MLRVGFFIISQPFFILQKLGIYCDLNYVYLIKQKDKNMKRIKLNHQTQRIIDRVTNNANQSVLIKTWPADEYEKAPHTEPEDIYHPSIIEALDLLFLQGHSIILETNQDFDDEGGDCYQAYLIKPEYREHYQTYWDANYEKKGKMKFQIANFEYICKYPQNVTTIWAGPY